MNLAVFKLFPCCLRAKHNKTRGMKMKKTTQQPRSQGLSSYRSLERENPGTERTVMSSGYSKELNVQNVISCYFLVVQKIYTAVSRKVVQQNRTRQCRRVLWVVEVYGI